MEDKKMEKTALQDEDLDKVIGGAPGFLNHNEPQVVVKAGHNNTVGHQPKKNDAWY